MMADHKPQQLKHPRARKAADRSATAAAAAAASTCPAGRCPSHSPRYCPIHGPRHGSRHRNAHCSSDDGCHRLVPAQHQRSDEVPGTTEVDGTLAAAAACAGVTGVGPCRSAPQRSQSQRLGKPSEMSLRFCCPAPSWSHSGCRIKAH
eukprot:3331402-Rhodomonas_salina.1